MAAISSLDVSLSTGGGRDLVAVDPAAVALVADGTPAAPAFPAAMLQPVGSGPIPAIVSTDAGGSGPIVLGQALQRANRRRGRPAHRGRRP